MNDFTFTDQLGGQALYRLAQMVRRTGRFQVDGRHYLEAARAAERPTILAAWHGQTMMLVGFFTQQMPYDLSRIVLPLPDDWRGGALAVFAQKLGMTPYRMNLAGDGTLATARQLTSLVRQVRQGYTCYITPDGPDGPAYQVKPGISYIAQKSGAAILPMGAYMRHGYRLNRWDQYVTPYPFGRISVAIGEPLFVAEGGTAEAADMITNALHRISAQAAANYYERGTAN